MQLYTIGANKKSAKDFFKLLVDAGIEKLLDIRLNNNSQLLGFTKGRDLEYFCVECHNIKYEHIPLLAPTKDLLKTYQKDKNWPVYERDFEHLLKSRPTLDAFNKASEGLNNICLLCSESKAIKCHRRLVAEYIANQRKNTSIIHI